MSKNALITAGSKNTGFEMCRKFAENGYNIHLTSRSKTDAESAAKRIKKEFPSIDAYGYSLELSSVADIKRAFDEIGKNAETLDVFVANAANLGIGLDTLATDEEHYDSVMDVNLKGTFFTSQYAAEMMLENGGSIVLIGSVQGCGAINGRAVYGISKAAINAMSKYLAFDLAPYKIRVNCLVAGAIHTDRWENVNSAELERRRANYLTGCEATMKEIANAVYFLSDGLSRSITGTSLTVDSGVLVPILPYNGGAERNNHMKAKE